MFDAALLSWGGNRRGHGRRGGISSADAEAAEATLIAKGAPPPTTDTMMMPGHDRVTASFNKKRGSTPPAGSCKNLVKRHRPTRTAAVTTRVEVVIEPIKWEVGRAAAHQSENVVNLTLTVKLVV